MKLRRRGLGREMLKELELLKSIDMQERGGGTDKD